MNSKLIQRVRSGRTSASRTSSGRQAIRVADAGFRYGASGHGSRMPSQRATTHTQRPY